MFTFLTGEKKKVEKRKAKPWDKYTPGSKQWVDAHYKKTGGLEVSRQDVLMLMQDPEWRRERKKFFQEVRRLTQNMQKRSKLIQ